MIADPRDTEAKFKASRDATRLLVDGCLLDPRTIGVRLSDHHALTTHPFEMRIGALILSHELDQAGIMVETEALAEFVRGDMDRHREVALEGYIKITQQVATSRDTASTAPAPRFWITRVGDIYLEDDTLVISGEAVE